MSTVVRPAPGTLARSGWWVPVALVALSVIPVVSGTLRLVELAGGPQVLPPNPRIDAFPAPLVVHVVGAVVYAVLGAFQFPGRLRRRRPGWHRASGRVLVGAGLAVALSGLWMTLFYPDAPGGLLLWAVRLAVATTMAAALVVGLAAIRRHDVATHRAWMIRAYALGLGAGTQTLTQGVGQALLDTGDLSTALSLASGWLLNAAVAEWVIRRPARPSHRATGTVAAAVPR